MSTHKTEGKPHGPYILFKDVNVIFTGLLNPTELIEFLRGPPLLIEVHDRDTKDREPVVTPAVFGTDHDDYKIANAVSVTINPEKSPHRDPYGIARLNLSDLLRGHRVLNQTLPIRCPEPRGVTDPTWRLQENSVSVGHYMKANSELKVLVDLAQPINPDSEERGSSCPYGRMVYVFKHHNVPLLNQLRAEIVRINLVALNLDEQPSETSQEILNSLKMSSRERENKDLNVLTGFYMLDGTMHLLVLEGLKDRAIKHLWEKIK